YNHRDAAASRRWIDVCDSLSDKICQPTLHPLRENVRTFLFYAYNPAWEVPLDSAPKTTIRSISGTANSRGGPCRGCCRPSSRSVSRWVGSPWSATVGIRSRHGLPTCGWRTPTILTYLT